MTDRRFTDEEVAAIFKQATEAQPARQPQLQPGEGLTLAEIQEIGRQVGVAPELVARAATSLSNAGTASSRQFIGLPVGVGRTVELNRKLSDDEWERLVVDLRETFDARGRLSQEGSLRQWTNSNLQVLLEPSANGHRVRFRTVNGNARAWMRGGLITLGIAAILTIAATVGGTFHSNLALLQITPGLTIAAKVALLGVAQFALGAIRLPRWARRRSKQMEEISGRLTRGL